MVTSTAPTHFSISDFYRDVYTFQRWEVFPGHWTNGPKDVMRSCEALRIPGDLSGARVLDIAPWNGFFGFECIRRGAAQLVSLGPDDPTVTGYSKTAAVLGIADQVRYVRDSVYNLRNHDLGGFDVVLFLGLIYHLRYPLLALDLAYEVCNGQFFIDSPVIDDTYPRKDIGDKAREIGDKLSDLRDQPLLYFTKGRETNDPYNWFYPNSTALSDMLESCGFIPRHLHAAKAGTKTVWVSICCDRQEARPFSYGVEGYNENASRYNSNNAQPGAPNS